MELKPPKTLLGLQDGPLRPVGCHCFEIPLHGQAPEQSGLAEICHADFGWYRFCGGPRVGPGGRIQGMNALFSETEGDPEWLRTSAGDTEVDHRAVAVEIRPQGPQADSAGRAGPVVLAIAMPHRPLAVSRTEASGSCAEASAATGNLRQVIAPPDRV